MKTKCEELFALLNEFLSRYRHRDLAEGGRQSQNTSSSLLLLRSGTSLADSFAHLKLGSSFKEVERLSLLEEEVAALRMELEDCREDLRRDEDIFAEKVRELKKCRKQIKDLEAENLKLKDKSEELTRSIAALTAPKFRPFERMTTESKADRDANLENDLDISLAVVASEPDISQLIEDLETVHREKEDLLAGSKAVLAEKDTFDEEKRLLNERLRELDANMGAKERLIQELQQSREEEMKRMHVSESKTGEYAS
jgi:chromosome segregation ATPase